MNLRTHDKGILIFENHAEIQQLNYDSSTNIHNVSVNTAIIDYSTSPKENNIIECHNAITITTSDISSGQNEPFVAKTFGKNANDNIQKNINLDNTFKDSDAGPFYVFVEHRNLNIGRLHPMKLGEKLLQLNGYEKFIKEISRVGRNRIKIEVTSGNIANQLIRDPFFFAK